MMEILAASAREMGLQLSQHHLRQFERYYRELADWNCRFNLTAVTAYEQVQRRHFVDSLSCILALPTEAGVGVPSQVSLQKPGRPLLCADVGSGAGFPGIPLAILMPDAQMTLIEATQKKARFLTHICHTLSLPNVSVVSLRAETVGQDPKHREHYDLVFARAVAQLSTLVELCLPLCRPGGRLVAAKGPEVENEVTDADYAIQVLGGVLTTLKAVELPGSDTTRYLAVVDKIRRTPEQYPRNPGIPAKRPLMAR